MKIRYTAIAVCAAFSLAASAPAWSQSSALVQKAKSEGTVTVYTSTDISEAQSLIRPLRHRKRLAGSGDCGSGADVHLADRSGFRLHRIGRAGGFCLPGGSRNTLKQHFRMLVEQGHLAQHGGGRGMWYELR